MNSAKHIEEKVKKWKHSLSGRTLLGGWEDRSFPEGNLREEIEGESTHEMKKLDEKFVKETNLTSIFDPHASN